MSIFVKILREKTPPIDARTALGLVQSTELALRRIPEKPNQQALRISAPRLPGLLIS